MKRTFNHLSDDKKEQIITACIIEFGRSGYEKATTDAIIKRIGISKGGLYEYISSKRELFLYIVEYTYIRLYDYLRERIKKSSGSLPADILDRVRVVSGYAIDFYIDHPEFISFIVRTYHVADDDLSSQVENIFTRQYLDLFGDIASESLRFQKERIIEVLMWLLLKTRYYFLVELKSGKDVDTIRKDYMNNWEFYISIMKEGIYGNKG